jgi:hypothetical protein
LFDENSDYNKAFVGGMKIPFYDWHNGSEGYDKMIYTWDMMELSLIESTMFGNRYLTLLALMSSKNE